MQDGLAAWERGRSGVCVLSSTFSSIINAESWQTSSGTEKEGEVQTIECSNDFEKIFIMVFTSKDKQGEQVNGLWL